MQITSTSTSSGGRDHDEEWLRSKICGRKVKFDSYQAAMCSARIALRNGTAKKEAVNAYKCPYCSRFHWGNVDPELTTASKIVVSGHRGLIEI